MKDLWRAFKLVLPHRGMLAIYLLTSLGLAVFGSAPLILLKTFLNKLQRTPPHDRPGRYVDDLLTAQFGSGKEYIYALCILTFGLWVMKAIFDFLNTYIVAWLSQRLRLEAMEQVMRKLLLLDQPFFDKQKVGDMVSRMVLDGENLRRVVKLFLDFVRQPFMVFSLVAIAVYYDPYLFLIGAIGVPFVVVPLFKVVRSVGHQTRKYLEKSAEMTQAMLQNLQGMRIIHAYEASEKEGNSFAAMAQSLFRTGMRRSRSRAMQHPLTEMMLGAGLVGVMFVGGVKFFDDPNADPSGFLIFIAALGLSYGPVRAMMGSIAELAELLPSAERTFEILDVKPTIVDLPDAQPCPLLTKEIVFENVSFDYGRGMVLNKLNLSIRAGEKIGIVGRTGVGKSTLLSLLLRFYDPTAGRVLIDGVDIRHSTLATLRVQMALVNQSPFLFHASVADNIRYGKPNASDEEVTEAAKLAMVHDEVMAQPEGYQTLCGERGGELFSGGQRQRIAVARAILRNAPILLLDEATSALDADSERRVQEAIDKLVISRTSLIVAHRLSTLRNVDRILVFGDEGGIEAIGTHQELMITSKTYHLLWMQQHGGKDDGETRIMLNRRVSEKT